MQELNAKHALMNAVNLENGSLSWLSSTGAALSISAPLALYSSSRQ